MTRGIGHGLCKRLDVFAVGVEINSIRGPIEAIFMKAFFGLEGKLREAEAIGALGAKSLSCRFRGL